MKILFKVFPQKSHYNATFPFARALREAGHEIVYAGLAAMQSHVEAQGFAYFVEREDVFPHLENRQNQPTLTWWNMIRHWRECRRSGVIMCQRYARADAFDKLVRDAKPDLVLVDSPYTFFALSLYKHQIPFGMLESMMPLDRAPDRPPLDTIYVPTGTWLSRTICTLHWWRFYCKRAILGYLGVRADANRRFVLTTARTAGVDPETISFDRYFHIGLRNVPEFLLSPKAIDFPRNYRTNQFHVGVSIDLLRSETSEDYTFGARLAELVAARERGRPLVYCSLGTAPWRYKGAEDFLIRVVHAAAGRDWSLVIAVGAHFSFEKFRPCPRNVAAFQSVPQLRVLKQSDLMITHGGMNSIAECATLGVPMLVYPGTGDIDQRGNAARVVFHRTGECGCLVSESASEIANKIERVLHDRRYTQSLARLRADFTDPVDFAANAELVLRRAFGSRLNKVSPLDPQAIR
jgi:zeaxanthin glucosyltransferase